MNMDWTIAGIVVLVIFAVFFLHGWRKGLVNELISLLYLVIVFALVWVAHPYVSTFLKENTRLYTSLEEQASGLVHAAGQQLQEKALGQEAQQALLDNLHLPSLITNQMRQNNNAETYRALGTTSFGGYISAFLASKAFNGITFLLCWLLGSILVKLLSALLNLLFHLPVLKQANHLAGGLLGLVKGLILCWLLMLILTILCQTSLGYTALDQIRQDKILTLLYQNNPLNRLFLTLPKA